MKTKIYYFSGTGNSLWLAKELKNILTKDTELFSIADYKYMESIEIDTNVLGFVFPVYFHSIPGMVKEFIGKAQIKGNPYIFAVAACNAVPGHAIFVVDKLLSKKGFRLSAGYKVDMPGISVVDGYLTSKEVNFQRLVASKSIIVDIAATISNQLPTAPQGDNSVKSHLANLFMTLAANKLLNPKLFYCTENCTSCNTCSKVCPADNITMSTDRKPLWGNNCQHCLACLHWCPQAAVELGTHSPGKVRFQHPCIEVTEMFKRIP